MRARRSGGRRARRGASQWRPPPDAFLVRPTDDIDGSLRHDFGIVQGPDDLQPGEHAVDAIKLATVRLSVEMTSRGHCGPRRIAAGAPGVDIPGLIETDLTAGFPTPADEKIATLHVIFAQGRATASPMGQGADLAHLHQCVPKTVAVYGQLTAHDSLPFALSVVF